MVYALLALTLRLNLQEWKFLFFALDYLKKRVTDGYEKKRKKRGWVERGDKANWRCLWCRSTHSRLSILCWCGTIWSCGPDGRRESRYDTRHTILSQADDKRRTGRRSWRTRCTRRSWAWWTSCSCLLFYLLMVPFSILNFHESTIRERIKKKRKKLTLTAHCVVDEWLLSECVDKIALIGLQDLNTVVPKLKLGQQLYKKSQEKQE